MFTKKFINNAKNVHGNKYDYSKVIYIKSISKVCIICPEHGEFWQTPNGHLQGKGCIKCSYILRKKNKTKDLNTFIKNSVDVHNNRFDYSKVEYVNNKTKVCIICPEHGEFWQTPDKHLQGQSCPHCNGNSKHTKDTFIKNSVDVHNNRFDYSKVEYVNNKTKVCIICPEHGEFWQTPHMHLQGQSCPHCNQSKLEKEIREFLTENNIVFEEQKRFKWLGRQSLDFYLPEYNIGIECQGIQHFKPVKYFGGEKEFKKIIERDKLKKGLCQKNKIKLLYYTNKFNLFNNVINDRKILLKKIKQ